MPQLIVQTALVGIYSCVFRDIHSACIPPICCVRSALRRPTHTDHQASTCIMIPTCAGVIAGRSRDVHCASIPWAWAEVQRLAERKMVVVGGERKKLRWLEEDDADQTIALATQ